MASYGAQVMHPRAVELGAVHKVPIYVASSFSAATGTLIHGGPFMEQHNKVLGIAQDTDVARITIRRCRTARASRRRSSSHWGTAASVSTRSCRMPASSG